MQKIKILLVLLGLVLTSCIRHSQGDEMLLPPNPNEVPTLDEFNDSMRNLKNGREGEDKLKELLLENSDSNQ